MTPTDRAAIAAMSTADLEERLARAIERPPIRPLARAYVAAVRSIGLGGRRGCGMLRTRPSPMPAGSTGGDRSKMSLPPYIYLHRHTKAGDPRYIARIRHDGRVHTSPTFPDPDGAARWLRLHFGDLADDTEIDALRALESAIQHQDQPAIETAMRRVDRVRRTRPRTEP